MDAVATGATAEDNDAISLPWFRGMCPLGQQADGAAEDEGIAEVP